jgi:uracil phosphoribosyltransferase
MSSSKNVHVSKHPLISHKMTLLRQKDTNGQDFRRLLKEITYVLGFEATSSLTTKQKKVTTPMNMDHVGASIADDVAIIPILRAGLGMADGLLELLPMAAVHHIGMYRAEGSLMPIQYYNRLPRDQPCDVAYITDPCIATSNTICAVVSIVKRWGAKKVVVISAIAAESGVKSLLEKHPDVEIHIAEVDATLTEDGMIAPGLGDAGDRQFVTPTTTDAAPSGKRARE